MESDLSKMWDTISKPPQYTDSKISDFFDVGHMVLRVWPFPYCLCFCCLAPAGVAAAYKQDRVGVHGHADAYPHLPTHASTVLNPCPVV